MVFRETVQIDLQRPTKIGFVLRIEDVVHKRAEVLYLAGETHCGVLPNTYDFIGHDLKFQPSGNLKGQVNGICWNSVIR